MKTKREIPYKDRFLTGEREESNPYLTAMLYFLVGLMSVMLVMVVFVSMCRIEGDSMLNSYHDNDHILLYKFPKEFAAGDVVVFDIQENERSKERLIKRVVGTAGDELAFVQLENKDAQGCALAALYRIDRAAGAVVRVDEPYILEPMRVDSITRGGQYTVSPDTNWDNIEKHKMLVDEGMLYVLGDNRNDSRDSRYFGPIPESSVVGKEIFHFTQGSLLEKIMLVIFNSGVKKEVK